MKKLCGIIFLGFTVIAANANDIGKRRAEETGKKYKEYTTLEGRVYKDVTITEISDAGISITHADGLARLRYEQLTPEQREIFGITKAGAAAVYAEEKKAQEVYEAKVRAEMQEEQKAKDELFAKQTAALQEAERLAAERAQKQAVATKIESTLEIPAYPVIRGSENAVLYPTQRYSPSRTTHYGSGGYVYPGSGGAYYYQPTGGYYYPTYYSPYSPSKPCKPAQRGSIFHFTIK